MAGDDKATPVLGYSATGYFDSSFPVQGNIGYWMGFYSKAMVSVMKDRSLTRNVLWNGNSNAFMLKSASVNAVEPMISVKWDQGKTWNRFCPADENGPDGHAYVGCVGVSMAQAMSLYHYPRQGTVPKPIITKPMEPSLFTMIGSLLINGTPWLLNCLINITPGCYTIVRFR